jgi:hypothetical protein
MKITVTQDHINNGRPINAFECPVALALNDTLHAVLPDLSADVIVTAGISTGSVNIVHAPFNVTWGPSYEHLLGFDLPREAIQFINAFDAGRGTVPFEFDVELESAQVTAAITAREVGDGE